MADEWTIEAYIKEQDFYKNETPDDVRHLHGVLVAHGIEPGQALHEVECIVGAIANEYGC